MPPRTTTTQLRLDSLMAGPYGSKRSPAGKMLAANARRHGGQWAWSSPSFSGRVDRASLGKPLEPTLGRLPGLRPLQHVPLVPDASSLKVGDRLGEIFAARPLVRELLGDSE